MTPSTLGLGKGTSDELRELAVLGLERKRVLRNPSSAKLQVGEMGVWDGDGGQMHVGCKLTASNNSKDPGGDSMKCCHRWAHDLVLGCCSYTGDIGSLQRVNTALFLPRAALKFELRNKKAFFFFICLFEHNAPNPLEMLCVRRNLTNVSPSVPRFLRRGLWGGMS